MPSDTSPVGRAPEAETRVRRALDQIAEILNDLAMAGILVRSPGAGAHWTLNLNALNVVSGGAALATGVGGGEDGADGPPGRPGDRGVIGMAGAPGSDGEDGLDGRPGTDGRAGAMGLPEAGEPGEDGEAGRPGTDGRPGTVGPPGMAGEDGEDGAMGPPGLSGATGDLALSKIAPAAGVVVTAGYSAYVADEYELVSGVETEIGAASVLEIG